MEEECGGPFPPQSLTGDQLRDGDELREGGEIEKPNDINALGTPYFGKFSMNEQISLMT